MGQATTIAVLGATGKTGRPLVAAALADGHRVRALARSATRAKDLLGTDDHLTVVAGDLTDPTAVSQLVEGADVVIDVSGPAKGSPPDLRRRGAAALVPAMDAHGVGRLVALTGAGVRIDEDRPRPIDRVVRGVMQVIARDVLRDGAAYLDAVRSSDLEWTVVRAPRLVEADPKGDVRHAPHLGAGTGATLGFADLARYLLDLAIDGGYEHQAPVVSW